jgi:hypothetical protein
MNTQSHGQKETSKELAVGQVPAAWDFYVLRSFASNFTTNIDVELLDN